MHHTNSCAKWHDFLVPYSCTATDIGFVANLAITLLRSWRMTCANFRSTRAHSYHYLVNPVRLEGAYKNDLERRSIGGKALPNRGPNDNTL
eukprot:2409816-Amphidinium_carterae.1